MKRFLLQVATFGLIQVVVFAGLYLLYLVRSPEYLALLRDKEHRLARLPGERIVFVGGSNLAFGLDSPTIEQMTGRKVVNMGLYAGLGLPFMLAQVRGGLRPGDVVVLSPEYEHFFDEKLPRGLHANWVQILRLLPLRILDAPREGVRQSLAAADGLVEIGFVAWNALGPGSRDGLYLRQFANEQGDLCCPREPALAPPEPARSPHVPPERFAEPIELLANFARECHGRGITVFLAMPCCALPYYERCAPNFDRIDAALRRGVPAPMLVGGREATMPLERFHDSLYHPTHEGARERSLLLGRRLAQALASPGPYSPVVKR